MEYYYNCEYSKSLEMEQQLLKLIEEEELEKSKKNEKKKRIKEKRKNVSYNII